MPELVLSLLLTACLAPVVGAAAIRFGVLDVPNHRSSHTTPTPRLGGLACLGGVLAGLLLGQALGASMPWVCVAMVLAMSLVGFADDRKGLPASIRLLSQIAVGAIAGAALGGPALALAGAIVLPCVVNGVNFMDGINGITGLTMAVWGLTAMVVGSRDGSTPLVVLGGVCAGAALGFLPFNVPSARLFLGDGGSYLFGGVVGVGLLLGHADGVAVAPLAAPMLPYGVDVATTIIRRLSRGEPITVAHRDHTYQQLTRGGLSHLAVSAVVAGMAAALSVFWLESPTWLAVLVSVIVCLLYLLSPGLVRARAVRA